MVQETKEMTIEEIRTRGIKALVRELGAAGMLRFMSQSYPGKGDYTEERRTWVDNMKWEDILKELEIMESEKKAGSTK